MKLVYTVTGRKQFFLLEGAKAIRQVDANTATALMENGVEVEYR
jgi:hypothetical protein